MKDAQARALIDKLSRLTEARGARTGGSVAWRARRSLSYLKSWPRGTRAFTSRDGLVSLSAPTRSSIASVLIPSVASAAKVIIL